MSLEKIFLLKYSKTVLFSFYIKYAGLSVGKTLFGRPYRSKSTVTRLGGALLNLPIRKQTFGNYSTIFQIFVSVS